MGNKGIKTLIKWGLVIVLFGFIIDSLATILSHLPLLILLAVTITVIALKKKFFRK